MNKNIAKSVALSILIVSLSGLWLNSCSKLKEPSVSASPVNPSFTSQALTPSGSAVWNVELINTTANTGAPYWNIPGIGSFTGDTAKVAIPFAGDYTVTLTVGGQTVTQTINVATDNPYAAASLGTISFPASAQSNNAPVSALGTSYVYSSSANTGSFPVPISINGSTPNTNSFSVQVSVDTSSIQGLVASGVLPAGTIALPAADYTLNNTVTLSLQNGAMSGNAMPVINMQALQQQYGGTGQNFAIGLTIASSSSAYNVNTDANKVVVYFNADNLLTYLLKLNMINFNKWSQANISPGITDITLTANTAAQSLTWEGGDAGYGQLGAYWAVNVVGGYTYKIDMNAASPSGMTGTGGWFQLWITDKQPQNGNDITTSWTNGGPGGIAGELAGITTYSGCGINAFNGLLSQIGCDGGLNEGSPGVVSLPVSGTYYIVIKAGGPSLGSGITATNITMIPQ